MLKQVLLHNDSLLSTEIWQGNLVMERFGIQICVTV